MKSTVVAQVTDNKDLRGLRRLVRRLGKTSPRRLDDAICDIIDLKGYSLAVLLEGMPGLPPAVGLRVARKVEDFLFFHPNMGRKLVSRLISAIKAGDPGFRPYLVAALADVVAHGAAADERVAEVADEALELVELDTDPARKGKAVEMLSRGQRYDAVPAILAAMRTSVRGIEEYIGFSFIETCLFALKRLGGEPLLRLLVNPTSVTAMQQLRLQSRRHGQADIQAIDKAVKGLSEDFSQVMLKVVELTEFNLPFAAMIHEGLSHKDKWIRQAAAASMNRMTNAQGFEHLQRMLDDPAPEVRLMAATSLGHYQAEDTGELLVNLALSEKETLDIRMNALYALFTQKNLLGLARVIQSPDQTVSLNAQGVSALLIDREEGLKALLVLIDNTPPNLLPDLFHYILELARAEDLHILLDKYDSMNRKTKGEAYLGFLRTFFDRQAGPTLEKALAALDQTRRLAMEPLQPPKPVK